eukprot:g4970.t1
MNPVSFILLSIFLVISCGFCRANIGVTQLKNCLDQDESEKDHCKDSKQKVLKEKNEFGGNKVFVFVDGNYYLGEYEASSTIENYGVTRFIKIPFAIAERFKKAKHLTTIEGTKDKVETYNLEIEDFPSDNAIAIDKSKKLPVDMGVISGWRISEQNLTADKVKSNQEVRKVTFETNSNGKVSYYLEGKKIGTPEDANGIPNKKTKRGDNRNLVQRLCVEKLPVLGMVGSENCLYLDIYSPAKLKTIESPKKGWTFDEEKLLPVAIWIHGGAFLLGDSYQNGVYDGSKLAMKENMVVVSISYRLGPLGFLTLTEMDEEDINRGLTDQQIALEWVHNNIKKFGGDKDNVTLMGQKTQTQLECAEGKTAEELFLNGLATTKAVFTDEDDSTFAPLFRTHLPWGPVVQEKSDLPHNLLQDVPSDFRIMMGFTAAEGTIFAPAMRIWVPDVTNATTPDELEKIVKTFLCKNEKCDDVVNKTQEAYTTGSNKEVVEKLIRDYLFACPTILSLEKLARRENSSKLLGIYLENLDQPDMFTSKRYKSHHMLDTFFLFDSSFKARAIPTFNKVTTNIEKSISSIYGNALQYLGRSKDQTPSKGGTIGNTQHEFAKTAIETGIAAEIQISSLKKKHNCNLFEETFNSILGITNVANTDIEFEENIEFLKIGKMKLYKLNEKGDEERDNAEFIMVSKIKWFGEKKKYMGTRYTKEYEKIEDEWVADKDEWVADKDEWFSASPATGERKELSKINKEGETSDPPKEKEDVVPPEEKEGEDPPEEEEDVDPSRSIAFKITNLTEKVKCYFDEERSDCEIKDISTFDVSAETSMYGLFSLNGENFNQDISEWKVSNVTDMSYMFGSAEKFNQDMSKWNVSKVTDMTSMFFGAKKFNQDISKWNVSKVTDTTQMFDNAKTFNQNLSEWKVSEVTNMSFMFDTAEKFDQDISEWDVSKVTDMSRMFQNAKSFNQDISKWDVSNVTDMTQMFYGAEEFDQDIGKWDVSKVKKKEGMFKGAKKFTKNLSKWKIKLGLEDDNNIDETLGIERDAPKEQRFLQQTNLRVRGGSLEEKDLSNNMLNPSEQSSTVRNARKMITNLLVICFFVNFVVILVDATVCSEADVKQKKCVNVKIGPGEGKYDTHSLQLDEGIDGVVLFCSLHNIGTEKCQGLKDFVKEKVKSKWTQIYDDIDAIKDLASYKVSAFVNLSLIINDTSWALKLYKGESINQGWTRFINLYRKDVSKFSSKRLLEIKKQAFTGIHKSSLEKLEGMRNFWLKLQEGEQQKVEEQRNGYGGQLIHLPGNEIDVHLTRCCPFSIRDRFKDLSKEDSADSILQPLQWKKKVMQGIFQKSPSFYLHDFDLFTTGVLAAAFEYHGGFRESDNPAVWDVLLTRLSFFPPFSRSKAEEEEAGKTFVKKEICIKLAIKRKEKDALLFDAVLGMDNFKGRTRNHCFISGLFGGDKAVTGFTIERARKLWNNEALNFWYKPENMLLLPRDFNILLDAFDDLTPRKHSFPAWVIKDSHGNRAKGIRIVRNAQDVRVEMSKYKQETSHGIGGPKSSVAQPFLYNPLLVDGYHFAVRVYFVVSSVLPLIVWMYKDAFLDFTSEKFKPISDSVDLMRYLSNLDRTSEDSENAGYMHLNQLWNLAALKKVNRSTLLKRMQSAFVKAVLTTSALSTCQEKFWSGIKKLLRGSSCYELYGVDFMFDDSWQVYLLDINNSPSMVSADDFRKRIKANVMSDIVKAFAVRDHADVFDKSSSIISCSFEDCLKKFLNNLSLQVCSNTINDLPNCVNDEDLFEMWHLYGEVKNSIWENHPIWGIETPMYHNFERIFPPFQNSEWIKDYDMFLSVSSKMKITLADNWLKFLYDNTFRK